MDIKIGKISYSEKLKLLTWSNFKKFWNNRELQRTGITAEEASLKFGIKIPGKKSNKKGVE